MLAEKYNLTLSHLESCGFYLSAATENQVVNATAVFRRKTHLYDVFGTASNDVITWLWKQCYDE